MPNRATHVVTSSGIGLLFAAHKAGDQPEPARVCELAGGLLGGCVGGRAPDICEPPISPRHRGSYHSVAVGGMLLKVCNKELDEWQRACRRWADDFARRRALVPTDSVQALLLTLAEIACRMLVGFIAGFLAGYVTHLSLDACTPNCIALV